MQKAEASWNQCFFLPFEKPERCWEVSSKEKERQEGFKRKKRKGEEAAGPRREEQWDPCSCAVIVPQVGDKTLYRVIA